MVTPEAGTAQQLECRVELTRPYGHGMWWNPVLVGTRRQLGAALDELAARVGTDTSTHLVVRVDPQVVIHYSLEVSGRGFVVMRYATTVALIDLPARLRTHAAQIRARRLR